jgi:uncharacterized membrane protein YtjA (UPF0391 family)
MRTARALQAKAGRALRLRPDWHGGFMIKWALIFFVISLIAGVFGFTNIAAGARGIAKVLFYVALAIFLIVLVFGVLLGVLVF